MEYLSWYLVTYKNTYMYIHMEKQYPKVWRVWNTSWIKKYMFAEIFAFFHVDYMNAFRSIRFVYFLYSLDLLYQHTGA